MSKSNLTNYFPHESGARNDDKIIRLRMRHGAAGYGVYFMILERLRECSGYLSRADYEIIAYDIHEDAEMVRSVIEDYGLFELTDGGEMFFSPSLSSRMEIKDAATARRSEGGRKAMSRRWEQQEQSQEQEQPDNSVISDLQDSYNKKETKETKKKKEIQTKETNSATSTDNDTAPTPMPEERGCDDDGKFKTAAPTVTAATATTGDGIDNRLRDAVARVGSGPACRALAEETGTDEAAVAAAAREIAVEWSRLGEWDKAHPVTHLQRTVRCRLRDRCAAASRTATTTAASATAARIAAEREREKAERDAAAMIDSRAALAQYMASRGYRAGTSLAQVAAD